MALVAWVFPWPVCRMRTGPDLTANTGSKAVLIPQLLFSPPLSQGIWRIPVDEIDRPGSFASHMNRSIVLLLDVLSQLKDHHTLLKISLMLQRTPDQGK